MAEEDTLLGQINYTAIKGGFTGWLQIVRVSHRGERSESPERGRVFKCLSIYHFRPIQFSYDTGIATFNFPGITHRETVGRVSLHCDDDSPSRKARASPTIYTRYTITTHGRRTDGRGSLGGVGDTTGELLGITRHSWFRRGLLLRGKSRFKGNNSHEP